MKCLLILVTSYIVLKPIRVLMIYSPEKNVAEIFTAFFMDFAGDPLRVLLELEIRLPEGHLVHGA